MAADGSYMSSDVWQVVEQLYQETDANRSAFLLLFLVDGLMESIASGSNKDVDDMIKRTEAVSTTIITIHIIVLYNQLLMFCFIQRWRYK